MSGRIRAVALAVCIVVGVVVAVVFFVGGAIVAIVGIDSQRKFEEEFPEKRDGQL